MKRTIAIAILLVLAATVQAQTWSNFWQPRPALKAEQHMMAAPGAVMIGNSILEFKPTAHIAVTQIRPGLNGASTVTDFLDAFGPALTLQHSTQDVNGINYADYSASAGLLLTGSTTQAPVFIPEAILTVGFFNNVLQAGVGYDLAARTDDLSRWSIHIGLGINITNN